MGFFDKVRGAFGGREAEEDVTVAPSQLLREAGIDPGGLKFGFSTGTISVSGTIPDESDRAKIIEVLSGIPGISTVDDNMAVAKAAKQEPAPVPEPSAAEPPADQAATETETATEGDAAGRSYTVQSGDSLWKIAEAMYGNGSKYMKIFEANKGLLENPDRIFPGQELKIPDLED